MDRGKGYTKVGTQFLHSKDIWIFMVKLMGYLMLLFLYVILGYGLISLRFISNTYLF